MPSLKFRLWVKFNFERSIKRLFLKFGLWVKFNFERSIKRLFLKFELWVKFNFKRSIKRLLCRCWCMFSFERKGDEFCVRKIDSYDGESYRHMQNPELCSSCLHGGKQL